MSDRSTAYGRRQHPMLSPSFRTGQRPPNYGKRYPAEVYTADEVLRAMACCGRGPGAFRNRAMIAVMWRSGLRVSEALALVPRDLNFELGAIRIRHGKGDKYRMAPMDAQTAALLETWLTRRGTLVAMPRGAPVFCTYERGAMGRALRAAYVRDAFKRAGRRAEIERFHPHGLRHTFAYELAREKRDLLIIQKALGHADARTTYRYINHLAPLEMIAELRAREWPATPGAGGERPPSAE